MNSTQQNIKSRTILPGSESEFDLCPTVMTEGELIKFLRISTMGTERKQLPAPV